MQRISSARVLGRISPKGAVAALSTEASTDTFVKQRKAYGEQLSSMRKQWSEEIRLRGEAEARQRAAEKEKVVLAKAIRLREKRKQSVVRQAADKAAKIKAAEEFEGHLANNLLIHEDRISTQEKYYHDFADELTQESEYWLTPDNIDSIITEEFFEKPSSSGLLFKDSEHWRYALHTLKVKRYQDNTSSEMRGSSLSDRMDRLAELRSTRRLMAQEFLEPMIGTGAERARYNEILAETNEIFQSDNKMWEDIEDADDYFLDEIESGAYEMDGGDGTYDPNYVDDEFDSDDEDEQE
jgi:hypothetical protein